MKTSPKHVKVDLLAESQKRKKYSTRRTPTPPKNALNFSFSHENSEKFEDSMKKMEKQKVSKKLFGEKPVQRKEVPIKYQENWEKRERSKSLSKERDCLYPNKKSQNRESLLFKKSLDKLKKTFFSGIRNNRDQTVRTLKEIGKYAQYRKVNSKRKAEQQDTPPRKYKNIPVQFVGFDPNSNESRYKTLQDPQHIKIVESQVFSGYKERSPNKEMADKGTYFNFEEEIKKDLMEREENLPASTLLYKTAKETFERKSEENLLQEIHQEKQLVSTTNFESINQIQIDAICQIFQMCDKFNQNDRMTMNELIQLLKEFERLYFIRVIQQSEAGSSKSRLKVFQSSFNELLREFEATLKIIFYRRQACDIYDCLYYLKESQKLDRICSLFMGLKKILQL